MAPVIDNDLNSVWTPNRDARWLGGSTSSPRGKVNLAYSVTMLARSPRKPRRASDCEWFASQTLSAQVQGDEGEIYCEDGTSVEPESASASVRPNMASRRYVVS